MDYSAEFNRIFSSCKEKGFIATNFAYLKAFFEKGENLNMLKHALTTKRNFTAIKVIDKLRVKVVPFLHINQHTYASIFWLNKMSIIPDSDFAAMRSKFEIMKNYEKMFEDTENGFIMLQIDSKRWAHREEKSFEKKTRTADLGFERIADATFFIDLDEILDMHGLAKRCTAQRRSLFIVDEAWSTLAELPGAPSCERKAAKLREIRQAVGICGRRNTSHMTELSAEQRRKIELVNSVANRLQAAGIRYFLCSAASLGDILCAVWLYFRNIDFDKAIKIADGRAPEIGERQLVFGKTGNVPFELLGQAHMNWINASKEQRIAAGKNQAATAPMP